MAIAPKLVDILRKAKQDLTSLSTRITALEGRQYIQSSGVSGNWEYIKWSNGLALCVYREYVAFDAWDTWGGIYETGPYGAYSFPFAFEEEPKVMTDCIGYDGWVFGSESSYDISDPIYVKTKSPSFYALRGASSSTVHGYVFVLAFGRWK